MRRWRNVIVLGLPVVVLLALPLYAQVRLWRTPSPRWTVDAHEAGISMLSACRDAAVLALYNVRPVEDEVSVSISRDQARTIADRVFLRHRLRLSVGFGIMPLLVTLTPPDGMERIAWVRVLGSDTGGATLIGKADIVYIDAQTGDPLILVTDVTVGDPTLSCGLDVALTGDVITLTILPLALLAAYLIVLALVSLFTRRSRSRQDAKRQTP